MDMAPSASSPRRLTVSVALCTYNGARFVADQLASILAQSRPPDEVVICDDRSSDDTVAIIARMGNGSRTSIRLFENEKNLGYLRNFEKALALCEGDVVFFCDQDDVWYPQRIETMLQPFADNDEVSLVYSDAAIVDEALKPLGVTVFGTRQVAKLREGPRRSVAEVVLHPDLKGCLTAYRSSLRLLLLPIPAKAESLGWGHDHWFATIAHAVGGVCALDSVLMSYRRHGRSAGQDPLGRGWSQFVGKVVRSLKLLGAEESEAKAVTGKKGAKLGLMLDRLREIRALHSDAVLSLETLDAYIRELEEAVLANRVRSELRAKSVVLRLPGALRLLRKGWYAKHFSGAWSLLRDVFLP